jgi:hypothetical protein
LLAGISRDDRPTLRDNVLAFKAAVERLRSGDPADRDAALADATAALDGLRIAPKLRDADSPVRWAIEGAQVATYAIGLGAVLQNLRAGMVPSSAAAAFAVANAADAIAIVGNRLGTKVPGIRSGAGEPDVGQHPVLRAWLAFGDEGFTTFGGAALFAGAAATLGGAPTIGHWLEAGVAAFYTVASGRQWFNSARRGYHDPKVDDLAARGPYLGSRRMAAGASLLLGLGLAAKAFADAADKNGMAPPPSLQDPTATTTPTPTATPSSTPTPTEPPKTTKPSDPADPGDTDEPGGHKRPPHRDAPAQVVVRAGDPRRATLWGIAEANQRTLLTPEQIAADRGAGGHDAVVAHALRQLFQLNPERGFRPELMDGVATAVRGDPDTIQPGWEITAEKPVA